MKVEGAATKRGGESTLAAEGGGGMMTEMTVRSGCWPGSWEGTRGKWRSGQDSRFRC